MDKQIIQRGIFVLCMFTGIYASESERKKSEAPASQESKSLALVTKKNLFLTAGVLVPVGGLFLAYKSHEKVRKTIDEQGLRMKHFVLQNCIVPLHLRIDEIKEEGPSKKDFFVVASLIGGSYGLKKSWDFFEIGHLVKKWDLAPTKQAFKKLCFYVSKHKKKVAAVTGGCIAALGSWWVWNALRSASGISQLEQFLMSLTDEQRTVIEQKGLHAMLDAAHSDPLQIHSHEEFMSLLTENQKVLLERLVEEHIKNNPHLAFID